MMRTGWQPGMTLDKMERFIILEAYRHYHGNKTQTAAVLGIAVRTLDAKLEKYESDQCSEQRDREEEKRRDDQLLRRARGLPPALFEATSGNGMESTAGNSAEQPVPVRERSEVQEMPPAKVASGGSRKRR